MNDWKEYNLGELTTVVTKGTTPAGSLYTNEGINYIKSEAVGYNGKINNSNFAFISRETHQKLKRSQLQKDDILFSMAGIYLGKSAIVTEDFLPANTNQALAIIRLNQEMALPIFILYYLRQKGVIDFVNNMSGQSAQPNINFEEIKSINILLPTLNEQRSIAFIFSSLDDKIDLLRRQNKTLEQLAETLFREWFVEEANLREETKLGDYVDCINGYSYSSSELNPSDVALVTLKSFNRNGGFSINGFKEFTGKIKNHQVVKEGDLVVAHTDITQEADVIGNPALIIEDPRYKTLIMTMDLVKVVPKDNKFSIPFIYHLMRTREFKFHCLGCSNGTTVLHLSKSAIPSFSFPKPNFEKVKLFTIEADKLTKKFLINHSQIRTLTQLRDTLLPKLMSGEVRAK
ncbi:MAG: restriction endonuclease subunit S [Ignavibacteriaceae bacterium]|nr:restriction endonuclease subunit S [Ignavibacteriaceae bacterium]